MSITDPCPTCNGSGRVPAVLAHINKRAAHPTVAAVTYTLTVPIVRALDVINRPLTARQIQFQAGTGSLGGIIKECNRLCDHGLLFDEAFGRSVVYRINRDHLAYEAAKALVRADDELWAQESPPPK